MAEMRLKFDAALPYQRAAIDATLGLFDGQPLADSGLAVTFNAGPLLQSELGLGNNLVLDHERLFANLHRVQEQNDIPKATALPGYDYAVEMETGTGKTYVYLRSAFDLHKTYGFTKFVIVVPSIPIREGVLHSISTMREHFQSLYGVPFDHYVYDSKHLGRLRQFATNNTLQFLVINIQAFQRDVKDGDQARADSTNVIYRDRDTLSGYRPIEFLQATHPIVIIDEPQKMSGDASVRAISQLHPLCTLRYSATHPDDTVPRIYKLGPIEALDQKLVKRIEVASVVEDANVNEAFVELLNTDARKQSAQVRINVSTGATVKQKKMTVRMGDNLEVRSEGRQEYQSGYIVSEITFGAFDQSIRFANGLSVETGKSRGGLNDEVMQSQLWETIRTHLEKERVLRAHGIKVLSLLFIDRVSNYREYADDGAASLGKIGRWFEAAYDELIALPRYRGLIEDPVETLHNGYFSADRRGAFKDTSGATRDDEGTYELIMREKERLLSFETPLRFIFSLSALREGWDNPNVFQICTLNETQSIVRKRQEIGRGLRLPVNQQGERVHDENINRLTVIANESYKAFAESLQKEYEEDLGIRFGKIPRIAFAGVSKTYRGVTTELDQIESGSLWQSLQDAGYIDDLGTIQSTFDPKNDLFVLQVPPQFEEARAQIVDVMNKYVFSNRFVDARRRQQITLRKEVLLDPEFEQLWNRVSQRTRYRISFDSGALIEAAAERIMTQPAIRPLQITIERADIEVTQAGVVAEGAVARISVVDRTFPIPDVLAYLQNETMLTRNTLAQILIRSGRAEDLRANPQAFITMAAKTINAAMQEIITDGIEYERIDGLVWEMRRLEEDAEKELTSYLDNLYEVQNAQKTPFDYVQHQSDVEKEFARSLDRSPMVRFFVKLPQWFKVDTPVGPYNPDWAIMLQGDTDKLYLVSETKGSTLSDDLRATELKKIHCGKRHFQALGVDYQVTTSLNDMLQQTAR
ncbi:DEAD/DEAH box helicase family protein [soil metagenome]